MSDVMVPVRGAREEEVFKGWRGSSRSSRFAGWCVRFRPDWFVWESGESCPYHHLDLSGHRLPLEVSYSARMDLTRMPLCYVVLFVPADVFK